MSIALDGSPVDLYALLPERGEGELVAAAMSPPASILELGCGTGRMTRQLVRLGYAVTAVDESSEMLAHVQDAETVASRIEGLDLHRRFDLVLLASNLFSTEPGQRRAFLETCTRHTDTVIVETLPFAWQPKDGEWQLGDVVSRVRVDRFDEGVAHGNVDYRAGEQSWSHSFSMRVFANEADLRAALSEGGLRFSRWLDPARGWFVAIDDTR